MSQLDMSVAWPHLIGMFLCLYIVTLCVRLFLIHWFRIQSLKEYKPNVELISTETPRYVFIIQSCLSA